MQTRQRVCTEFLGFWVCYGQKVKPILFYRGHKLYEVSVDETVKISKLLVNAIAQDAKIYTFYFLSARNHEAFGLAGLKSMCNSLILHKELEVVAKCSMDYIDSII